MEKIEQLLRFILHHPDKKEILEEMLVNEIKTFIKNLVETIILKEREIFCQEEKDVGNGFFTRGIRTPVGEIKNLRVARTRYKKFRPTLLEMYKKELCGLEDLIIKIYAGGCSTRDISQIFKEIYGCKYSPSAISQIVAEVEKRIKEFREAPIKEWYPVIYVDGTYLKCRRGAIVEKEVVYVVMGISEEGKKRVLGYWVMGGSGESALNWKEIFKELYKRGLREVLLVVGDNLPGLEEAVKLVYPLADFQGCVLHKIRNTLKRVRKRDRAAVAEDLRKIYASHNLEDWKSGFERFKKVWGGIYPDVIRLWERDWDQLTVYLKYPYILRRYIYTTNGIERFIKEIKRRTKVIELFPKDMSIEKVVYLVVEEMNERYAGRRLNDYEAVKEELEELRRARYGLKEVTIFLKEEVLQHGYTQNS